MRYKAPSWKILTVTAAGALAAAISLAAADPIEVRVDGQPVLTDVPPVRTGADAIYVPVRALGEALGGETRYEERSGRVVLVHGDQVLRMKIGDVHATLNGMPMTLRHPPFRVRGRTMIGLHAVQRAFGVRVKFDKASSRVDVQTLGTAAAP